MKRKLELWTILDACSKRKCDIALGYAVNKKPNKGDEFKIGYCKLLRKIDYPCAMYQYDLSLGTRWLKCESK